MDELLARVKVALRLTIEDADLDNEVRDLIESAKLDLKVLGIVGDDFSSDNQKLYEQAIKLYVKGHYGYDNADSEKLLERYEALKSDMSVHSQYDGE